MPDLAMCNYHECPDKDTCYRYTHRKHWPDSIMAFRYVRPKWECYILDKEARQDEVLSMGDTDTADAQTDKPD